MRCKHRELNYCKSILKCRLKYIKRLWCKKRFHIYSNYRISQNLNDLLETKLNDNKVEIEIKKLMEMCLQENYF